MKLLLDADYLVYKNCAACEIDIDFGDDIILVQSRFSEAYRKTKSEIERIKSYFGHNNEIILFFSDALNYRKEILADYKGHRNRKKPCAYRRVINALGEEYELIRMPTLEADDAMGIYATKHPGNCIVSPDKDMRQIPGTLYDFKETTTITEEAGFNWHYIQTLSGDNTDGYSGCPTFGIKRSVSLFEEEGYKWETIVKAFKSKDLDEDVALQNARLAKILTHEYYDFDKQEPILWTPTTST